jgi:transcriptional regulator with XRE-family HTH domain
VEVSKLHDYCCEVRMDDNTIGRRIAFARKRRGFTQMRLAQEAHVSKSLISHVETGSMPATPTLVAAVAGALHVDVSELYGQPYRGNSEASDRVHAAIPEIRQVLAYADVPPSLDAPARSLHLLEAEIARLKRLQGDADHVRMGAALPALIAELSYHAYSDGTGRAWTLLNRAYSVAQSLARRLGYQDLSQVAIERCAAAAARSDDPNLPSLVQLSRALLMLSAGAFDGAIATVDRAIADLPADTDASAVVLAALHLRAAVTAARAGRAADAWEHHGLAAELTAALPRRTPDFYELQVSPDNVAIHQVAVAVELGDYDRAVRDGADLEPSPHLMAERHAHHQIDMSRAWIWTGRPDKAEGAVLTAERIAPQMTRYHPMARETVTRLVHAHRTLPEPLAGLSTRMGLQSAS